MTLISNEAYVTLVTNEAYVSGACVLAQSLRNSGTAKTLCCMVVEGALSEDSLAALRALFTCLSPVSLLDSGDAANLALLGRPELGPTFTKICLWQLTQFKKVVFLDADTLVLQNIDDLFGRPEFSACPDAGWPDCFNSGVFVAVPSEATFHELLRFAANQGSFDGGDQGLLNAFFSSWSTSAAEHRIPFTYNLTINAAYSYAPAFARFQKDVKVVHFIGAHKPWNFYRFADGGIVPRGDSTSVNLEFVHLWWRVREQVEALLREQSCCFGAETFAGSGANQLLRSGTSIIQAAQATSSALSAASSAADADADAAAAADFASYRIKWSADVEKYFSQRSAAEKSKFIFPALTAKHQQQQQASRNHRVFGGRLDEAEDCDDRFYED
jgi:glycogenin glucosyltransferase